MYMVQTQYLRRSQFIITYGPGSILETRNGPRLILSPELGLFYPNNLSPEKLEISDARMVELLKFLGGEGGTIRIFGLPAGGEHIYRTVPFPEWRICSRHSILFNYSTHELCPRCRVEGQNPERYDGVRFVLACENGHLDDVNWDLAVHGKRKCSPDYYEWKSGGPSLCDITITCPICKSRISMADIYNREWSCTGRLPEREAPGRKKRREACDKKAKIKLRQSSDLRIPEILCLFTIPPIYTELHRKIIGCRELYSIIYGKEEPSPEELKGALISLVERSLLGEGDANYILDHPGEEIRQVIRDLRNWRPSRGTASYGDFLREEFESLRRASKEGAPPLPLPNRTSPIIFEVPRSSIKTFNTSFGLNFRVAPITRLRVVIVQRGYRRGYRRLDTTQGTMGRVVDVSFTREVEGRPERWYPGVEIFGEGLFITLEDGELGGGDIWNEWREAARSEYPDIFFRDPGRRDEINPVFVWWHTLSHLLIRVLSIDSGYSSASIRERIYLQLSGDGETGGIVLYTVQPGEGTMGGLISVAGRMGKILERAMELSEECPNDPLCFENEFRRGRVSGSACYACVYVSETSCEHRNMWLDRRLLMEVIA